MAKRKAAVNDIIYELDNEDIEVSSDDEVKEPKINRLETTTIRTIAIQDENNSKDSCVDVINVCDSPVGVIDISTPPPANELNGGKTNDMNTDDNQKESNTQQTEDEVDSVKKITTECNKTTIFNEDIVIDSPGNSDLGVEGCENRTPLVTVRFKDNKMAKKYKEKVKAFMLNLIKLHEGVNAASDSDTDLELDIWPEDFNEDELSADSVTANEDNNLFFVDTDPCADQPIDIPSYSQASTVISNIPEKEPTPPPQRRGPICFNCDGSHQLRDCVLPKNHARIAENRKNMNANRVGRYHVEDDQKYGHLIPGRISGQLRHALGLKRNELPLHIYRMRVLGYPPGWLEEARISHSGISMFDSSGNAIQDPEEEEGEVCEPGSKDKFDIKKILDFPGFNVPASSRYVEEAHLLGLPPMSKQDCKMAMLQYLAPNAMKAYKRKKLTFFPSASKNTTLEGQAEMELDSGDEVAEFPSNPPLPDEEPPPPPPPPSSPPPPPPPTSSPPPLPPPPGEDPLPPGDIPIPIGDKPVSPEKESAPPSVESSDEVSTPSDQLPSSVEVVDDKTDSSCDDLEVVEVEKVTNLSTDGATDDDVTVVDDDNLEASGRDSPTLDDLEEKKRLLLSALDADTSINTSAISILDSTEEFVDKCIEIIDISVDNNEDVEENNEGNKNEETNAQKQKEDNEKSEIIEVELEIIETTEPMVESVPEPRISNVTEVSNEEVKSEPTTPIPSTPESKAGHVKETQFGTPVMNIASPYVKLPSDVKFAKDICDVINFENLPNSTGKYKQISALLRKVKSEVDRIQES